MTNHRRKGVGGGSVPLKPAPPCRWWNQTLVEVGAWAEVVDVWEDPQRHLLHCPVKYIHFPMRYCYYYFSLHDDDSISLASSHTPETIPTELETPRPRCEFVPPNAPLLPTSVLIHLRGDDDDDDSTCFLLWLLFLEAIHCQHAANEKDCACMHACMCVSREGFSFIFKNETWYVDDFWSLDT